MGAVIDTHSSERQNTTVLRPEQQHSVRPVTGLEPPPVPTTHYLDNRIYTDPQIFAAEAEAIFARAWKFVLHESEIPRDGDFRTLVVGGRPLIVVRGDDGTVRSFFNVCPHRGAHLLRAVAGRVVDHTIQCFYHLWTFDTRGRCAGIAQSKGYEACGLGAGDVRLREVRTETLFGMIFVCLDNEAASLRDFLGAEIVEALRVPFGGAELEVFHLHRADLKTNWKHFVETNCEGYHELLHLLNRTTAVQRREYRNRRWHLHRNGHLVFEQATIGYERLALESRDTNLLPGMVPNGHVVVDLFPDVMLNCRSTVVRIDSLTPIAPGVTRLECRGLGVKGDTPEQRRQRIDQHNQVWGPMGRNLPEDIWAVETQWATISAAASRYSIIAREETSGPMDDATLRHFYAEWRKHVRRHTHDIDAPWNAAEDAASDKGRNAVSAAARG